MQNCSPVKGTDGESNWASFFLPSIGMVDSEAPALGTSVVGKWGVDGLDGCGWGVDGQWMGPGSKIWPQASLWEVPHMARPWGGGLWPPFSTIPFIQQIVFIRFMKWCRPVTIKTVRPLRFSLFYKHYLLPYSYLKNCFFPKPSPRYIHVFVKPSPSIPQALGSSVNHTKKYMDTSDRANTLW